MNLHSLPPLDREIERLHAYQSAFEDEKRRVEEALAKEPKDRTSADDNAIAHSRWGTAARHP